MPSPSPSRSASRGRRSRSRDRGDSGGDSGRCKSSRGRDHNEGAAEKRRGRDGERRPKDRDDRKKNDDERSGDERERNGDKKRRHRDRDRDRSRGKKSSKDRRRSKKRRRRSPSSSSSSSSSSSTSSSSDSSASRRRRKKRSKKKSKSSSSKHGASKPTGEKAVNERLLAKLSKRDETLEEREERRAKRRAARITARFGYTAEDNPFRDPNLHETFTWKKKEDAVKTKGGDESAAAAGAPAGSKGRRDMQEHTFAEIDKVRQRRKDRELHFEEMERLRAEESRMRELEGYDEWARKEEEFHLQQQRQRSAIRLVEGRERPVDVLAQNMLLFGLSEGEKENRARVKYREKYSALEELEKLEANLEEPHALLKDLKLGELEELLVDIDAFRRLEKEAVAAEGAALGEGEGQNTVIKYWDALYVVTSDEIKHLKSGGEGGANDLNKDIQEMFKGQSMAAMVKMKADIEQKLRPGEGGAARFDENGVVDTDYWQTVLDQLTVHLAKMELSEIHSHMLVRQLEKLEARREELQKKADAGEIEEEEKMPAKEDNVAATARPLPIGVEPDFGNLEEELGLTDEVDVHSSQYAWQDRYRPRKPRYFNRVKTGYDWNAYNKTHYDHDNPPPKIVQGYKFNVFYPDLIDRMTTPQYKLEKADTDDFCILRFTAGPPYEDVAFKIINRQWNKSRKRGFRCTFERGVLSLYFNFQSHWYRR